LGPCLASSFVAGGFECSGHDNTARLDFRSAIGWRCCLLTSSALASAVRPVVGPCRMWAALILVALATGAAAGNSSCACSAGFPPLPAGGFKSISGYAGCIINYVQFEDATGAVVFTSGTLSGGEPFSVSCPGNNTITGFSYLCNAGSGPNGVFPMPTFASLSTLGGITCSNGSAPFYSGALDENICELASGYTQLGFLDCGADGSATPSCFSEGGGCVQGSISHVPCSGTSTCQLAPTPTPTPIAGAWTQSSHDPQHSGRSTAAIPLSTPAVAWKVNLQTSPNFSPIRGAINANETVIINDGAAVRMFSLADGHELPSLPLPGYIVDLIAISPDGGLLVLADTDDNFSFSSLLKFDSNLVLVFNTTFMGGCCTLSDAKKSLTVGPDGTSYVITRSSPQAYALGTLWAIRADGSIAWSKPSAGGNSFTYAPALCPTTGMLYTGDFNGLFQAFNASGSLVWSYPSSLWWWTLPLASSVMPSIITRGYDWTTSFDVMTGNIHWIGNASGANFYSTSFVEDIHGDIIQQSAPGGICKISIGSGATVWCWQSQSSALPNTLGDIAADASGNVIFIWNFVVYVLSNDGALIWSLNLGTPGGIATHALSIAGDGSLLAVSYDSVNQPFLAVLR